MGIGSSLKKFVKKAAPIAAMVATPFLGPTAGALLGAASGALSGGGVKEALLGGLGGYAAGGFGQGIKDAGGFAKLMQGPGGGIANVLKTGFGGIKSTPLGQGVGSMVNKFTGMTGMTGQGAMPGGQEFLVKTPEGDSYFATADKVIQGVEQGSIDPTDIMTKDGDNVSMSSILGMYQQSQGQGQGGGINPNLLYGLAMGAGQYLENEANPQFQVPLLEAGKMDYDQGRGTVVNAPVLTADFAKGGRIGFADGDEVRDAEYEGWKQMYEKNPEVAMMMHGNSAKYLEKYNKDKKMELNSKAKGGIIGLANGGEPTMEMDYRGGGFIPVGAKERADDVPARLSKNEFVMTADAVRAAGGGSIEKGSQRMYDLMNSLEARA